MIDVYIIACERTRWHAVCVAMRAVVVVVANALLEIPIRAGAAVVAHLASRCRYGREKSVRKRNFEKGCVR